MFAWGATIVTANLTRAKETNKRSAQLRAAGWSLNWGHVAPWLQQQLGSDKPSWFVLICLAINRLPARTQWQYTRHAHGIAG
jgi:hypothetical protein